MTDEKEMTNVELKEAVTMLLQREEERAEQARRLEKRSKRRKRQATEAGIARLAQSIEIIKWCVIGISSVMALGLIVVIVVVMEVEREVERIKGEVVGIQREAELIRDKIRHPLEAIGSTLGRRLEGEIGGFIGDSSADE